jgi:hypothetical protein
MRQLLLAVTLPAEAVAEFRCGRDCRTLHGNGSIIARFNTIGGTTGTSLQPGIFGVEASACHGSFV